MELLNPTYEDEAPEVAAAPRLNTLRGATVGVISNGKENTRPFFDHLEAVLRNDYAVAEVVRRVKPNYSAPAPAHLMAEVKGWSAVLAGVGD